MGKIDKSRAIKEPANRLRRQRPICTFTSIYYSMHIAESKDYRIMLIEKSPLLTSTCTFMTLSRHDIDHCILPLLDLSTSDVTKTLGTNHI